MDTLENNGLGKEEQGGLAKTMNADASNIQVSLAHPPTPRQGPQTGPNDPSP